MLQVESIEYDPLKSIFGRWIARSVPMRRLFYTALGMLFLRQWHVRAELKRIARSNKVRDILDAGSGYGQYTHLMGRLFPGARITAVDVKNDQVADCRWFTERVARYEASFEVADLTTFCRPESFDLALSVDVMEHILDDEAVYRNLFASLRAGGRLVVVTPAAGREQSHVGVDSVIGEHVREGYTEREFHEKISTAGFTVEKLWRTYHPLWGKLAWLILQRVPMRLLSLSKFLAVVVVPWMLVLYLPAALFMWLDLHSAHRRGGGWLMVACKP
jgi:SAM-dependent methyltransferase